MSVGAIASRLGIRGSLWLSAMRALLLGTYEHAGDPVMRVSGKPTDVPMVPDRLASIVSATKQS